VGGIGRRPAGPGRGPGSEAGRGAGPRVRRRGVCPTAGSQAAVRSESSPRLHRNAPQCTGGDSQRQGQGGEGPVFVACSTLCFAREPLEAALRLIAELEFDKFELALVESGEHLRPSEAGDHPEAALQRLRRGPSLIPSSLYLDLGPVDWSDPLTRRRFDGLCRLAKALNVAVVTLHAAPARTPLAEEIKRLSQLQSPAMREGLVLALLTHSQTLTADPRVAVELCRAVPGLGLTLDPSHYLLGPQPHLDFDV